MVALSPLVYVGSPRKTYFGRRQAETEENTTHDFEEKPAEILRPRRGGGERESPSLSPTIVLLFFGGVECALVLLPRPPVDVFWDYM